MARVARPAGQRGRTIPARSAAPVRPPGRDARLARIRRPNVDTGVPAHVRGVPAGTRGVGAGATDSRNHRRGSTGVPGRVPGATTPAGPQATAANAAPAAQVSLSRGRRLGRRLARRAPRDRRHRRRARRRHGRRRRRRRWPARSRPTRSRTGTAVWTPEDQLAYGTSYTLTATAKNAADKEAKASSTFTTVTPTTVSTPSIGPLDGTTVGVGMPIRVYFDDPVADKAAVESHLKVTTSTPTDGVVELDERLRGALPALAVLAGQHPGHPRREPLRRELRRRHLGREEPLGVLRHRRQARLRRRRRRAHPAPSTTATRSCRPTR